MLFISIQVVLLWPCVGVVHQYTGGSVVTLSRCLHQYTGGSVVALSRCLHQSTGGSVVALSRCSSVYRWFCCDPV